jgi:hypothetical protein
MALSLITKAWPIVMQHGRKFVLVALCDASNDDGECFLCVETIAYKCGMGVRTVQGHLIDLESDKFIWREERLGRSSIYSVNIVVLENAEKNPLWLKRQAMKRTPAKAAGVAHTPAEPAHPPAEPAHPPAEPAPIPVSYPLLNDKKKKEAQAQKISFSDSSFKHIPDEQISVWTATYPAVNVQLEIMKAAAWIDANPANAKSDYKRFLNGWLTRAQDKAPRMAAAITARPARQTQPMETFRERDDRLGREKWELMTGRVHPESVRAQALGGFVVDVATKQLGN